MTGESSRGQRCEKAYIRFGPGNNFAPSSSGKGVFTSESEVLSYPDIPDMGHEFGALLQFGTTFELMEFLVTQQINVSQRMAEEHAKCQMIKHTLNQTTESEDEGPLARVGRKTNAGIHRIGIELPSLNRTLVGVHRELATVTIGTKNMVAKNKNLWKTIKAT